MLLQVLQQIDDLGADAHIEGAGRFVADDEGGLESARARATPMRCRWPPENSCG